MPSGTAPHVSRKEPAMKPTDPTLVAPVQSPAAARSTRILRLWWQRWHQRRIARLLAEEISDDLLRDTGLTRQQLRDSADRPFWKP
jgi:uncharacterized protein YjiS (DUF1127 family)